MTDVRLQELYGRWVARAANGAAGPGAPQCVTPDKLLALVRREGPEARRLETLDHVMACEACGREYELVRAIHEAAGEIGAAHTSRRPQWWLPSLALAAGLLLAVGIGLSLPNLLKRPDIPRGGAESVILIAPSDELAANVGATFAWHPVPQAHRYILEVLDEGEIPVFSRETTDTTVVLGQSGLPPGKYRWWVRALTPAGQLTSPMRGLRARSQ